MYVNVGFGDFIQRTRDLISDGRQREEPLDREIGFIVGLLGFGRKDDVLIKIGCKIKAGVVYIYFGWVTEKVKARLADCIASPPTTGDEGWPHDF